MTATKDILRRLSAGVHQLSQLDPERTQAYLTFNSKAVEAGALPTKTKELIALALGVAARCDGCIAAHVRACLQAGATQQEIAETLNVCVSMGGGPSLVYATRALEALQELSS